MKNCDYDMMILGPATRDVNVDYTGAVDECIGGAVTFCTPAAAAAGAKVIAAIKMAPGDEDVLRAFDAERETLKVLPSARTTLMRNVYKTADRERRDASCDAQSDPVLPDELPEASCRLYHLAGLLYGDFPEELLEHLHGKGLLAADAQGFLRHNEGGRLVFHDWADKLRFLPYMDFWKVDAAEAEILTGLTDRREAARRLHEWGAGEVLLSHNSQMLAYDGKEYAAFPVKARNMSGRTGRGDTTFASYLAMRVLGADMKEALLYATACVSLKMETPGVFAGMKEDVEAYIREFYI